MKICFTIFCLSCSLISPLKQSNQALFRLQYIIPYCLQSHASLRCYAGFKNQTESKERKRPKKNNLLFFHYEGLSDKGLCYGLCLCQNGKQKQTKVLPALTTSFYRTLSLPITTSHILKHVNSENYSNFCFPRVEKYLVGSGRRDNLTHVCSCVVQ